MEPGKDYAAIVSSDNLALGMYLADALADAIGGKGDVGAMYFANDFYVTNLRYEGFIARVLAKYPDMNVVVAAGHNDPNKGQEVAQALLARYPTLDGLYASWSHPGDGRGRPPRTSPAARRTTSRSSTRTSTRSSRATWPKAASSPASPRSGPYDQGVAEATIGALTLIGEQTPVLRRGPAA